MMRPFGGSTHVSTGTVRVRRPPSSVATSRRMLHGLPLARRRLLDVASKLPSGSIFPGIGAPSTKSCGFCRRPGSDTNPRT